VAGFIFTGPDGTKYYAAGDDPEQAFAGARQITDQDIAAMRTAQDAVTPKAQMEREMQRGAEINRATEEHLHDPNTYANIISGAADFVPGVAPARAAMRGDYAEAAYEGGLQALPLSRFLPSAITRPAMTAGAAALGLGAGSATAGDEELLFKSIKDPAARAAAIATYEAKPTRKLKAEYLDSLRKEIQGKLDAEQAYIRKGNDERKMMKEFEERNKEMIKSLTDEQRNQFNAVEVPGDVPATLKARADYLGSVARNREEHKKSFAERHAPEFEVARVLAAGAGAGIPALQQVRKIRALEEAARKGTTALEEAPTAAGSLSAEERTFQRSQNTLRETLERTQGYHPAKEAAKEFAYGSVTPYGVATFAPNAIEALGRHSEGDIEGRDRALGKLLDPTAIGLSMAEGGLFTLAGQHGAMAAKNAFRAQTQGAGTLRTMEDFATQRTQAAAAEAAAQAGRESAATAAATQRRTDRAASAATRRADKTATSEEAIAAREQAAYERGLAEARAQHAGDVERVSAADASKRAFAEKTAREEAQRQEMLAAVEQIQKKAPRRKNPLQAVEEAAEPLTPGGGGKSALGPGGGE
jgi:hypothetical protein